MGPLNRSLLQVGNSLCPALFRRAFPILILLGIAACAGSGQQSGSGLEGGPGRSVAVTLGQPVDAVEGFEWVRLEGGGPATVSAVENVSEVTIRMASGFEWTTPAETLYVNAKEGIVSSIDVLPLTAPVTRQEAIARVERIAAEIGADLAPMRPRMAEWLASDLTGNAPWVPPFMGGVTLADKERFLVRIRRQGQTDGWFIVLIFADLRAYGRD